MERKLERSVLPSIFLLCGLLAGCAEVSGPGTLQGLAQNAQDLKPYVDAEVKAVGPSGTKTVNTDLRGVYLLELASGLYTVTATMGKKSQSGRIKVLAGQSVRLNFRF